MINGELYLFNSVIQIWPTSSRTLLKTPEIKAYLLAVLNYFQGLLLIATWLIF